MLLILLEHPFVSSSIVLIIILFVKRNGVLHCAALG